MYSQNGTCLYVGDLLFHIILLICGIQKNDTDELICKAETETDKENKRMDTNMGGMGGMNWEAGTDIYTLALTYTHY